MFTLDEDESKEFQKHRRITLKASIEAVKRLYLFLNTLAISRALHIFDSNGSQDFDISKILVFLGVFIIIFQFTMGTFNLLDHIIHRDEDDNHERWTKSLLLMSIFFLLTGAAFYVLGVSLGNANGEQVFNIILYLFVFDWLALILAHRPLDKYRRLKDLSILGKYRLYTPLTFILWGVLKSIYVFIFGIIKDYAFNTYRFLYLKIFPTDPENIDSIEQKKPIKLLVKLTHYWWASSNFWTLVLFLSVDKNLEAMALILIFFGFMNFWINHDYFFGKSNESSPANC